MAGPSHILHWLATLAIGTMSDGEGTYGTLASRLAISGMRLSSCEMYPSASLSHGL